METTIEATARHRAAAQAVQAGVKIDPKPDDVISLRVGLNSAFADQEGLARLLIAKGVFTEAEYTTAMADAMEREKARLEGALTQALGRKVTLEGYATGGGMARVGEPT